MSVLLFNLMVQIVLHVNFWQLAVWSGGSVLGLQPSSLDKKITL